MCLGANLGDAVFLAADSRPTMSSGERVDDVQKLVKITDTLWSAGAGTLSLTAYLQAVLAERQPANVVAYLQTIQPFSQKTLEAHIELYDTLAGEPGHADYTGATVMSVPLVGGFDPDSGGMSLFGFASGDRFETRLWRDDGVHRWTPGRSAVGLLLLATAFASGAPTPEGVADACRLALQEVAKVNPEIGPAGHVVIVSRTGAELRPF